VRLEARARRARDVDRRRESGERDRGRDVGATPVMSMMAMAAPVCTTFCSRVSITTWVRALSRVPTSGSARMSSQSSTTGVESSIISACWRV